MGKSIVRNTFFKFSLSLFNVIIPTIVTPYVNWLLGRDQVNIYTGSTTMLQFFLIFATFGVYNYGIREINRVRDDKTALAQLFTNLFCFGLITSLLTSLAYGIYVFAAVPADSQQVYGIMTVQIIANIFMVEWMNEALENYGFIAMKTMIIRVISTALLFLVVRHPDDVMLYAGLMSVTVLVNNAASFCYVKRRIPFDFSAVRLGRYIRPLFVMLLIANVNYLYTQLDRMFLIQTLGTDANTAYTLPSNLINMVLLVVQSLLLASVPRLSYYVSHGQDDAYMDLLRKSSRSYFLLVFPLCIGLFCLSYEAMYFYSSPKFVDSSYPVLQIFSLRCLASCLSYVFTNQILYLKDQERAMVKILAIGGGLNLLFDSLLTLTHTLSPITAILSTAAAEVVMLSVMYWFIRKKMQVDFRLFSFANMKYLYVSLPFLPITWGVRQLALGPLWTALLAVALCGIYYFGILLLTRDPMLFYFVDKLRARFCPRGLR